MTHPEITRAILSDLQGYASPLREEKIAINHPTSMQVFGLMVADLRSVTLSWLKILHDFTSQQCIELAIELVNTDNLEAQQVAFEFLWRNKKALQALSLQQILSLAKNMDNWVSVDMFCLSITGYCWRMGVLDDQTISQWAKDENLWFRRMALVSTVPLNLRARGGTGDTPRTLHICSMLVDDRKDLVIKALSWALRVLSIADKRAVEQFMDQHAARIHSRVKREVESKLLTGKKIGRENV
ncbi:MAG: DNA alkylation repair protein [Verrucomicrobia bacterium]|nr:DNA alkylation repair protein [Prolixibacteraceae bacterium]